MEQYRPCRVQWVTRPDRMGNVIERLTEAGGTLVARGGYDVSTEDLDAVDDAETGHLSIAEFRLDPVVFTRLVVAAGSCLTSDETMIVDLEGLRPKVQLLPVPCKDGIIVRRAEGVRRLPRRRGGLEHHHASWLARQVAESPTVRGGHG